MPFLTVDDDTKIFYTERGAGFSHSYLLDHAHFQPQISALADRYRVLAYDHRGHGKSGKPAAGYSMERIYRDAEALLDAMKCGPVHFVGLSTGGFVGMRLAFRRPELLKSLVLMSTSSGGEPTVQRLRYQVLFGLVRMFGFSPVIGAAMGALFGRTFLKNADRAAEHEAWRQRIRDNDVPALIAFGKALFSREDVTAQLSAVKLPTLVLVGNEDKPTPPKVAHRLAEAIPGARLELVADAGHVCTVEQPEVVNSLLLDFFASAARA